MNEFVIWWGLGGVLIILAVRNWLYFRKGKAEPVFFVMSEKMLGIYRSKKRFDDKRILEAVRAQGILYAIIGIVLLLISGLRKLMTL
ncbi:MAG: hypothetical protein IEMM0008_1709 [bacterium]|nr:MAG: hypothetical protein IEMM0008_1709 [bacterium]